MKLFVRIQGKSRLAVVSDATTGAGVTRETADCPVLAVVSSEEERELFAIGRSDPEAGDGIQSSSLLVIHAAIAAAIESDISTETVRHCFVPAGRRPEAC